jgi:hypothetical protein
MEPREQEYPDLTRPNGGPIPLPQSLSDQWRTHLSAQHRSLVQAALLALPSGMSVRAKRPHLLLLMQTGRIPDTLRPRVESMIAMSQDGGEDAVKADLEREQKENPAGFYADWMNLLDTIWVEAVIDPPFTREPDTNPDALPVADVGEEDKTYLFMWCQGVDESVATFLDRKARSRTPLGHAPAGEGIQSGPGGDVGSQPID